jgi:hypothetical protein
MHRSYSIAVGINVPRVVHHDVTKLFFYQYYLMCYSTLGAVKDDSEWSYNVQTRNAATTRYNDKNILVTSRNLEISVKPYM